MESIGKFLLFSGMIIALVGLFFVVAGRFSWLGRLPGDILIQKKGFTLYVPLATSIIISIIASLFFWLFMRK